MKFIQLTEVRTRWTEHPVNSFVASHIIDYPTPVNLNYFWSFGSTAGICLVIQLLTGIFLAMHYTPHIAFAFNSVEHIMRDVNAGWLIRYLHANGASMFFIVVYCHIFRGLYFGSYIKPRALLWSSGVIIFLLMMATAFMGYVLPWGQMSFWGATVITNVRGRKALKTSRFQGNTLVPDKGLDQLSSSQTAQKILWELNLDGYYNNWDIKSLQHMLVSNCISSMACLAVSALVIKNKILTTLRETIDSFLWTHATAKWKAICLTMNDSKIYAEGRPEKNFKKTIWRPYKWTSFNSQYLNRKGTRLFSTWSLNRTQQNTIYFYGQKYITHNTENLQNNLYLYKIAIEKDNLYEAFKSLKSQCLPGIDGYTKASYTKQLHNSISKLQKDLRLHKYKPSPIKIVHIQTDSGNKYPLGISSVRDKIVQATFKKRLELIYEPIFRNCSFGFRPSLNCHSAVKQIKKNGKM